MADDNVIEVDPAVAAAMAEVSAMLAEPVTPLPATATLASRMAATGAPLSLHDQPAGGRCVRATRNIAAGEILLTEPAVAWCLRSAREGVLVMTDADDRILAALPSWPALRTLRDTLSLAPEWAGRADEAWLLLSQLCATEGGHAHTEAGWPTVPTVPTGVEPLSPTGADNAIPCRAQLLSAIAQCNAFVSSLPLEDSQWKRGLLWVALCRLQEGGDRDRLFYDEEPLSNVSSLFVLGAQFNHACGDAANLRYTAAWEEGEDAPCLTVRADADIPAGSECTISYVSDTSLSVAERRRKLLLAYRFRCACAVCVTEEPCAGNPASDPLRSELFFPHGTGLEGATHFFASGGAYPSEPAAAQPADRTEE